jgi:acetate---CoA ligase (ADP-forming)
VSPVTVAAYEADVVLRGGSTVRIRAIRPDDEHRLAAFFRGLSDSARRMRFCAPVKEEFLDMAAGRFSEADDARSAGLVATVGDGQRIVGHAMYSAIGADRAEVAFAVADDRTEQGLGTLLLGELAQIAASRGIRVFEAGVLPVNHQMLGVFRASGFPVRTHTAPGEIRVEFPTDLSGEAL